MADFNKAIELNPDSALALWGRSEVKKAKGDLDGAIADSEKSLELQRAEFRKQTHSK